MAEEKVEDRGDILKTDGDEPGETGGLSAEEKAAAAKEAAEELGLKEEKKEPLIPKGRFDEAVSKARKEAEAATERADKLEAQLKANEGLVDAEKIEQQLDDAEDRLEKAIADGNAEKKAAIRREIRQLNRQISDAGAAAHAARATAIAVEQIRYDALVSTMEAEHSELNPDNEETYDQDVVNELTEYKTAFEAAGYSSSEAMKKALKAVYRDGPKPEVDKEIDKVDKAAERKEEAVKKGIEAKKKQPGDSRKVGLDSDKGGITDPKKLDPKKLTDKEWDALTPEQLSAMRGDRI